MILEYAVGTIIGNISTALVLVLVYFNFLLFEDYFRVIIWSILFSQALRGAKEKICRMLRYLSRGEDIQRDGLLYSICTQIWPYLMQSNGPTDIAHKKKRIQEFILDNGIFIFSMIGAVSIYVRMFSWVSFLQLSVGLLGVLAATLYVLDRRIFHYRFFISDEVLVSALLLLGCCTIGVFVLLFLGTESYMEGNRATMHFTSWVQKNVVNDERTRNLLSEQVQNGKAMIASGLREIEGQYNTTMWFAPLKALVYSYYDASDGESPAAVAADVMNATKVAGIFDIPANITWTSAFTMAYSKFNLSSTEVTDWTAKGLEISSVAFGSVFQVIFFVVTFTIAFISIGIKAVFFVTSLFYLLCTEWDPVERFVHDLMPINSDKRPALVISLRRVIEGVFFLPMKISSLHAIVTLVSLSMMANDFVYLGTFITFFISIVPIIPAYLVCIPWVLALWSSTSFIKALFLFVIHYVAFSWIDQVLYEKSLTSINAYVSALSVVFGVYVFGLEGVVFGPLLVCGVQWAYEASNHGIQAASFDEVEKVDRRASGNNIFSSAFNAIYDGIGDNLSRRFSFDASSPNTIVITLQIHNIHSNDSSPRGIKSSVAQRVRFVALKEWSYEELLRQLRHTLRVSSVKGIYTVGNNAQILSVLHILPNETIRVEVECEPKRESNSRDSSPSPSLRVPRPPVFLKRNKSKTVVKKTPVKLAVAMSPSTRLRRSSCSECFHVAGVSNEEDASTRSSPDDRYPSNTLDWSSAISPSSNMPPPPPRSHIQPSFRDLSSFQKAAERSFCQAFETMRSQSLSSSSSALSVQSNHDEDDLANASTQSQASEDATHETAHNSVETITNTTTTQAMQPQTNAKEERDTPLSEIELSNIEERLNSNKPVNDVLTGTAINTKAATVGIKRPSLQSATVIENYLANKGNEQSDGAEKLSKPQRRSKSDTDFDEKASKCFWKRWIEKKPSQD